MYGIRLDNHLSRKTYNAVRHAYTHKLDLRSEFRLQKLVDDLSDDLECTSYDCCVKSCCLFAGQFEQLDNCPYCHESRFDTRSPRRPRQTFLYIPLIPRLRGLFANPGLAASMEYRHTYDARKHDAELVQDVFDCDHYRELREEKVSVDGVTLDHTYFSHPNDIALGLAGDGIQVFKKVRRGNSTVTPLIVINYNLLPTVRTHLSNVLSLGVIPGPHGPKDMNSFLIPFKEECVTLAKGIPVLDARTADVFTLHAYTLFGLGDIPWVTKITCTKGTNGVSPCRTCDIQGVYNPNVRPATYYVPLRHPVDDTRVEDPQTRSWNPWDLPIRTEASFASRIQAIRLLPTQGARDEAARMFGLNGESILSTVPGIRMSRSFPWECLHLFFENTIPNLIRHWRGTFKDVDSGAEEYLIHPTVWEAIGQETADAMATIPSAFVGKMPNIAKDQNLYKGEFYSFWFLYLAPILLRDRFEHRKYYDHACQLAKIIKSCMDLELRRDRVAELREEMIEWVTTYER